MTCTQALGLHGRCTLAAGSGKLSGGGRLTEHRRTSVRGLRRPAAACAGSSALMSVSDS